MVKCIDCLHFEVCKHKIEELCKWSKIEDLIHSCTKFKDRTKYAEVVRCKDCKWYAPNNDGYWYGCAFDTRNKDDEPKPNDFCSYGERRDGE